MTTDFRALCAELVGIITAHANPDDYAVGYVAGVLTRARAALAEEPATWTEGVCGDGAALLKDGVMVPIETVVRELNEGARARAVLARWGNPATEDSSATQPVDGEVAELVARLSAIRNDYGARHSDDCQRAAELLQRQAPVPIPVTERLPAPEDCDAEGGCWWLVMGCNAWSFGKYLASVVTHWLPAHALPLPEVK